MFFQSEITINVLVSSFRFIWIHMLWVYGHCVKRSDVTRWKQGNKNLPPYFIALASSVKTKEVEVIEFHRIINILLLQCGDRLYTSGSDVYRRQILTSKVDPHNVRAKAYILAAQGLTLRP